MIEHAKYCKTWYDGVSAVQELEETSGVGGRKDILPVKNLSSELGPTTELTALMCSTLQQCLYAAEDYITECGSTSTLRSELSD